MDIKDFKARKLKLEADLTDSVNKLLTGFCDETGYYPRTVNVDTAICVTIGRSYSESITVVVTTGIEL